MVVSWCLFPVFPQILKMCTCAEIAKAGSVLEGSFTWRLLGSLAAVRRGHYSLALLVIHNVTDVNVAALYDSTQLKK
jgi:hypothetical protein